MEEAHETFMEWCKKKGIPAIARQTFVKKFGKTYHKKIIGPRGKRAYYFTNCSVFYDDIKGNPKNSDKVDHALNVTKTLKNWVYGNEIHGDQLTSHDPSHTREKNKGHDHDIKIEGHELITHSKTSGSPENKGPNQIKSVINLHKGNDALGSHITKEEGDQIVKSVLGKKIHLHGADTGVSIYGDKFNIAVIGAYYRQNTETVNRIMEDLGFKKGNTGSLGNVFFSRPLKGGEQK